MLCPDMMLTNLDRVCSYDLLCRNVFSSPMSFIVRINFHLRSTQGSPIRNTHVLLYAGIIFKFLSQSRIHQEDLSRRTCSWTNLSVGRALSSALPASPFECTRNYCVICYSGLGFTRRIRIQKNLLLDHPVHAD